MSENEDIERKIEEAFFSLAPDSFDEIMAKEPVRLETEEELIGADQAPAIEAEPEMYKAEEVLPKRRFFAWHAFAAVAALIICILSITTVTRAIPIDELYVDINPSVRISLNKSGEVCKVKGVNADGKAAVEQVKDELKGVTRPEDALVVLMDEFGKEGYYDDNKLDMLLSFCYKRTEKPEILEKLKGTALRYADEHALDGAVIVQSFPKDNANIKKAESRGVSVGKYHLLTTLEEQNHVALSEYDSRPVRELNIYIKEKKLSFPAGSDIELIGRVEETAGGGSSEEPENSTSADSNTKDKDGSSEEQDKKDKDSNKKEKAEADNNRSGQKNGNNGSGNKPAKEQKQKAKGKSKPNKSKKAGKPKKNKNKKASKPKKNKSKKASKPKKNKNKKASKAKKNNGKKNNN